jgi:hypothetical protein
MPSHLSHLNSYIGINKPFKCGVAVPVAFFDALLPISYLTDSTLRGFHFVITALVAPSYSVFLIGYSIHRLYQSLLEAILTFHQPDILALGYLRIVFDNSPLCGHFLTLATSEGMDFIDHL